MWYGSGPPSIGGRRGDSQRGFNGLQTHLHLFHLELFRFGGFIVGGIGGGAGGRGGIHDAIVQLVQLPLAAGSNPRGRGAE